MDLPTEVWKIVLFYLHLNDLIEMSATSKFFYYLSRENKLFIKKMNESKRLFNDKGSSLTITMTCALVSLAY